MNCTSALAVVGVLLLLLLEFDATRTLGVINLPLAARAVRARPAEAKQAH